jgi:preprotein translocase subunit YajC
MMDVNLFITAMMGGAQGQGGGMGMFVPMIIIFAIFYFMLIRPQQRKEKDRRAMIDNVKTGERVMFSGGMLGTITNTKENTVIVKIADGVKVEVARGGIQKILDKGEKVSLEEDK